MAANGGGGRRRAAKVAAWIGCVLLGLPLLLLVLVSTPPATRFIVRKALPKLNQQLNGTLAAERIGGSLLTRVELHGVTLRDPEGEVVLQAQRVKVNYSVWDLLHSKISLGPVVLERPIVRLLKDHPGQQYSLIRVFAKESDVEQRDSGTVDLTITDIELRDGSLLATVWREPAQPQQEVEQPLDTVQLIGLNVVMPLIHYSSGAGTPRVALAQMDSLSGRLVDPELELFQLRGEGQLQGDSMTIALETVRLPHSRFSTEAWLVTTPNQRRFDAMAEVAELRAEDISGFISGADIPPDWSFAGTIRTSSRSLGAVMISSPNVNIVAAGGSIRGRVTVIGADNEWRAQNSRLEVAGIEVERLLKAFNIPSNLRAQIAGVITADGQTGSADLRIAGAAGYGVRGPVNGHIRARGHFEALKVETELTGPTLGSVAVSGEAYRSDHLVINNVRGRLQRFNLAAVDARLPPSTLNGEFESDVAFGSLPRAGNLRLFLDSSMIREVPIDTALVIANVDHGLLLADTILIRTPGLRMTGSGTFGLYEDQSGDLTLTLDAPSLHEVGPMVAAFTHDSLPDLGGSLRVDVVAQGSLANYGLTVDARGKDLAIKGLPLESLRVSGAGRPDSFTVDATAAVDSVTTVALGGRAEGKTAVINSLTIARGEGTWRLEREARVDRSDGKIAVDSAVLTRDPGPGRLSVSGTLPGEINVSAERVPLADLLMKGNRDSLPDLDAQATYANGVVTGTLGLLMADSRPLTAAFTSKPLGGRLNADSLDLSLVGPLIPSIRKLGGRLDGRLDVGGAVDAPVLNGSLTIADGKATVPATGVAYHDLNGTLSFTGNALELQGVAVAAGKGRAQFAGKVLFARLDRPELDVALETDRFPIMNRRDFLEATATGDLRLTGSPAGATLTGNAVVNQGTAYLEKFLRSSGIDLSDPLYAQFVDTTVLREAAGSPGLVDALIDSLRIDSVSVDLGDRFWLRSPDASIQLAGRLTVNSGAGSGELGAVSGDKYRLVGSVRAVRGMYRMALAPGLTREFTVREGSIRYFGSPRTDAILDLDAEHVVRTATGDQVTITVHIDGSLDKPTLGFSSDVSPPLSETEVISYLVFGAPTAQAFLGREGQNSERQSVFAKSAQQLAGVLSGKIESAVVTQLGLPIDYFRIKPGEVQSGLAGTELVLGMQVRILGYPSYLRASPRFCPREQLLSLDHIGINLETRLAPQWGIATSVDPVQGCEAVMSGTAARAYQFGVDVFWEKR